MRSTKGLLLVGIVVFSVAGDAGAQEFVWAKRLGGGSWDAADNVALDAHGNVYTTGTFQGTADFDPGSGTYNLTSAGRSDVFISKLDANGNFVWARRLGGVDWDSPDSVALDASGNVITAGRFKGTADFDPGSGTYNLTSAGGYDVFISKLDANGNSVWAKRLGGLSDDDPEGSGVDASGAVLTTGNFTGTADFDPGSGTYNLTATGSGDAFVSKLNSSGNFVWAKRIGGTWLTHNLAMTLDASGSVVSVGYFEKTTDFDPGPGTFNLASFSPWDDAYVSKLDPNGNFVWAKQLGGVETDRAYAVAVDEIGNVVTVGLFEATADFNPGSGVYNLTAAGASDMFIVKLDSAGDFVWAGHIGDTLDPYSFGDYAYSISADSDGGSYITGSFQGTADFDPGPGTFNLTSAGLSDAYVVKLDSAGDFVWARNFGGSQSDSCASIALSASGSIYCAGVFQDTADFDPGPGTFNLTSAGGNDAYVSKLGNASDADGDGVLDSVDNCPYAPNQGQEDVNGCSDGDQVGDACECACRGGVAGLTESCNLCEPIWIHGNTNGNPHDDKIDVVFVRSGDPANPSQPYEPMEEFRRDVFRMISEGFGQNPQIAGPFSETLGYGEDLSRYNFYIATDDAGPGDLGEWPSPNLWPQQCPWREVSVIMHADDEYGDRTDMLHLGPVAGIMTAPDPDVWSPSDMSFGTLVHEFGHAMFALSDEYDGDTNYIPWAENVYCTNSACESAIASEGPPEGTECRVVCDGSVACQIFTAPCLGLGSLYRYDLYCIMESQGITQQTPFDFDCARRIAEIYGGYQAAGLIEPPRGIQTQEYEKVLAVKFHVDDLGWTPISQQTFYGTSFDALTGPDTGFGAALVMANGTIQGTHALWDPRDAIVENQLPVQLPAADIDLVMPFVANLRFVKITDATSTEIIGQADLGPSIVQLCDSTEGQSDPDCPGLDLDNDGIVQQADACPLDGDNDRDGDSVCGDVDNCPQLANPDQLDGDGDSVGDVCDCAPADAGTFAIPVEVRGLGFDDVAQPKSVLSWTSVTAESGASTVHDLMRGALAELPVGVGASESCIASGVDTSASDAEDPAEGAGFYYLVRGRNVCGSGTYGYQSDGSARASTACP